MPTYEYICKNCGERFEKVQSFSARPLKTHGLCGGDLQKVFHASGVVFKGSGFYATDNRVSSSSDSSTESTSTSTNGSGDKPTEKKSETPKKDTTSKKESSAAAAAD